MRCMQSIRLIGLAWAILQSACMSVTDPGLDKRYEVTLGTGTGLDGLKFHWTQMPVKIQYSPCTLAGCNSDIENAVKSGFEFWRKNATLYGEIQTQYGSPGDIVVSYTGKIGGAVIAKCAVNRIVQSTSTGQLYFVTPLTITIGLATDYGPIANKDFERVSAHELGHCLGLWQHSPTEGDLMYYQLTDKMTYSSRDLNSLRYLYTQKTDIGTYPASALKQLSADLSLTELSISSPPLDSH